MRYKKRTEEVEAVRWLTHGDHPEVLSAICLKERGYKECPNCNGPLEDHGFIDNNIGGYIFCPGDWVITDVFGKTAPMKDNVFNLLFEPVTN